MKSSKYILFGITAPGCFCGCSSCKEDKEDQKLNAIINKLNAIEFKNLAIVEDKTNYDDNTTDVEDKPGTTGAIHYNSTVDITKDAKDVLSYILKYIIENLKFPDWGKISKSLEEPKKRLAAKMTFDLTPEMQNDLTFEIVLMPKNAICLKDIFVDNFSFDLDDPLSQVDKDKLLGLVDKLIEDISIKIYIDDRLNKSNENLALRNKKVKVDNIIFSSLDKSDISTKLVKGFNVLFAKDNDVCTGFGNFIKLVKDIAEKKKKRTVTDEENNNFIDESKKLAESLLPVQFIGGEAGGIGFIINMKEKMVLFRN